MNPIQKWKLCFIQNTTTLKLTFVLVILLQFSVTPFHKNNYSQNVPSLSYAYF
jgi:hypothetical protein